MRYLIIGLGIYGYNLARDLTNMGNEVIGADNNKTNIEAIKDYISTVYYVDANEESSLALLPLNNVDLVIVAIGENFGASVKAVAMLKKLKVKHIYARAIDDLHASILQSFEIDRILTPEQRAARDLTNELGIGSAVQSMAIDSDTFVMKFGAPKLLYGLRYTDINFHHNYGLSLVAVTRPTDTRNVLGISHREQKIIDFTNAVVTEGDVMTCIGSRDSYYKFAMQCSSKDGF